MTGEHVAITFRHSCPEECPNAGHVLQRIVPIVEGAYEAPELYCATYGGALEVTDATTIVVPTNLNVPVGSDGDLRPEPQEG